MPADVYSLKILMFEAPLSLSAFVPSVILLLLRPPQVWDSFGPWALHWRVCGFFLLLSKVCLLLELYSCKL